MIIYVRYKGEMRRWDRMSVVERREWKEWMRGW